MEPFDTGPSGERRGQNVAEESGVGLASRHRGRARHVVRNVAIAGQEDLLHAEQVLVNLALIGVAVLDRHDGLQHLHAGHLGHNRPACAGQRDGVRVLRRVHAEGLGDDRDGQAGVGEDRNEGDRHEEGGEPLVLAGLRLLVLAGSFRHALLLVVDERLGRRVALALLLRVHLGYLSQQV
eukprot:scaffold11512_cov63-Phaeocystis_antarctica.AAC.3